MTSPSILLAIILLASTVRALPSLMLDTFLKDFSLSPITMEKRDTLKRLHERQGLIPPQGLGALPLFPPPFDVKSQYVSNTGEHVFVAPGPNDERGPCPGLNAMANHGYLPHNGRATIDQFVTGTGQVFGMGPDIATVLAVLAAILDGDLTSWSIGGKSHTGISGSHGNYETDSSPLRPDLFQYGNNYEVVMSQFHTLYDMQPDPDTANYNLDIIRKFRSHRFQESVDKNPQFFYGPINGILVSQAAHTFIYRFMSNKSAEFPEGVLDKATLKSFMSIKGPEHDLKWIPGHEEIPNNFYRRNDAALYTLLYFVADLLYVAEADPRILSIGCNLGHVDTYDTISPFILSGGVFTVEQLLASPVCFVTQFLNAELPALTGLGDTLLKPLTDLLDDIGNTLNCPKISNVNSSALFICPGFSEYGGPTAPVAVGAIQS